MNLISNQSTSNQHSTNKNLKYRLMDYVKGLTVEEYTERLTQLEKAMKIKRGMLNHYKSVEIGGKHEMNTRQLIAAAKILKVKVTDLFNPAYVQLIEEQLQSLQK